MNLFATLLDPASVPHTVMVICMVASLGLALGHIKIFGVPVGIAGVLFVGLLFGHFGVTIDEHVLEFVREFGLILFVYAIGLQVGPGFFSSIRKGGLPLNVMAASVVLLGVGVTLIAHFVGKVPIESAVGVLSGATTNTPSLGAAQQAIRDIAGPASDAVKVPGLGYAVAYPFGVIGIIVAMLSIKAMFRINPEKELEVFSSLSKDHAPPLHSVNLEVTNREIVGLPIGRVSGFPRAAVVISRIMHNGEVSVAHPTTVVAVGDVFLAVGPKERLDALEKIVGKKSEVDLREVESNISSQRVSVTRTAVLGKTLGDLALPHRFGVTVTRLSRMGLEFAAHPDLSLKFGDSLLVVGSPDAIKEASTVLGNSPKDLNDPHIIPLLVGITVGVIFGSLPVALPGLPAPVRLGLAGGPLIIAIVLSRIGQSGPLVWHTPVSANLMIRELGISLFLTCVGLRSGGKFVATLMSGDGVTWVLWGAAITLIPLLIVGFTARSLFKTNFTALCGVLSGAMTDPPALAFANTYLSSELPALSYATVYPLTMLLRVLSTQALVLLFMR
jgi:putative transport protein